MSDSQNSRIIDLPEVCTTFPQLKEPNILRENMIMTIKRLLEINDIIIVEGDAGIGKTTLLAQFASAHPEHTFCLFIRSNSRMAYDSQMLTRDLCDQIGWALYKEEYRNKDSGIEIKQLLRKRLQELQRKANMERDNYYFVVDGLDEIPKEGYGEKDVILEQIPFGIPRFYFILSGASDSFQKHLKPTQSQQLHIPNFSIEETRQFFDGYVENITNLQTIYKVSKGIPGHQASIRRLLERGVKSEDELLNELPTSLPSLFEMEWQVVEDENNELLRNALAFLAFDRRRHSIDSLSRLCKTDKDALIDQLNCCAFIEQRNGGQDIEFADDVFSRYASDRLANVQDKILNSVISDLINDPESSDAMIHLPALFSKTGRYEELLTYLSPQHIGNLIDCSESWGPLRQKTDLGVNTALEQERDGDLLRFSMQRATIASMEISEPWRSEIEAYAALDDFSAAYALVQRVATKADRLHLLAVIARMKKTKSLSIELELKDQIQLLYSQLDRRDLGDRGVEIASDLLYTQPELAIDLVQECLDKGNSEHEGQLDLALAHLSFKAMMEEKEGVDGMESIHQAFRSKIKDPNVQKFMDRISLFFGNYSADEVIAEVDVWGKPSDQIYALKAWAVTNAKREDAGLVIEYAIDTILRTTTYTANAKVYKELASPLIYMSALDQVKAIIKRLDGLREPIKTAGPTLEYVKLQATLAEAESRYNDQIAGDRLLEVYFYIDDLIEPGTKLATLAVLAYTLKKINDTKHLKSYSDLYDTVVKDLEQIVDEILTKTASHYEAVQSAIGALARCESKITLDMIAKLNTKERREAALVKLIEAITTSQPCNENFVATEDAYKKIRTITMRAQATRTALRGLSRQKNNLTSFLSQLYHLETWVEEIPNAEERCQALCMFLKLLFKYKDTVASSFFSRLQNKLHNAWESVDSGWSRVDTGFMISSWMADCFPDFSREFLEKTENTRKSIVLDSPDTANTYFLSVQLVIRSFAGLLKYKAFSDRDLDDLKDLIDKIPAVLYRVITWSKLALRFYMAQERNHCEKIVQQQILPLLDPDQITDKEALWDAIVYAAPAIHCARSVYAIELISKIPNPYRDDAYKKICSFLIRNRLPFESYDTAAKPKNKVEYADFLDTYNLLVKMENEHDIYWQIEAILDRIHNDFRTNFNNVQQADIREKLNNIATTKFQSSDGIQHEGYKILAEAQVARLDRHTNHWENFKNRANAIPNLADRAFVLMHVAAAIPNKHKTIAIQCVQNAKALIPQIPFFEDRLGHYEALAKLSVNIDTPFSKDCLRQAWNEAYPLNATQLPKARQSIIDFAHRLDPNFAATLASETDDDPGRNLARTQVNKRLDTLDLREKVAKGGEEVLSKLTQDKKQRMEIAKMLLSGLNSERVSPRHIKTTRQDIKDSSHMNLPDAYIIFSWVIENAVRRYSNTKEAGTILRPLYEAVRLSSDLAYRIASRIRSVTDQGIDIARLSGNAPKSGLIRQGEKKKALRFLQEWASKATGFIKITDPYFGLEEMELVKLIQSMNPNIEITVLTSRKYQKDVPQPWDESYRTHWRLNVSDADAGNVNIIMIGKSSDGSHPIHDRWWLAEKSGLRLGTSVSGLGMRSSEITEISESELPDMLNEVNRYIHRRFHNVEQERLEHSSFYL